ncbi:GNAT family N-acetyltransferase [Flavobacterium xueshanense]|uniref:Protein N-acetyltransferase, RimJ/RimL family n=1 Tax=Flavobacterium xueshanense TaxID=935223 RepID=A0A1I2CN44_9FLAO|nr:GNAT family N-acetyltransferase [Flavobacterium xueshanense]SFE69542.1 Protein N-acetyltransferase, RimJ/RimL family [Flavobacterium xueshanense]
MYKILIRPLVIEDALISWKWRNDPEVWSQTGNRPDRLITPVIEMEWIQRVVNEESSRRFAITVDDQYVGNVQLTDIADTKAQFHIFIGEKSFWGKGVANQATSQILIYAKKMLALKEVFLYVKKSNISAIKVYQKNHFIVDESEGEELMMTCILIYLDGSKVSGSH